MPKRTAAAPANQVFEEDALDPEEQAALEAEEAGTEETPEAAEPAEKEPAEKEAPAAKKAEEAVPYDRFKEVNENNARLARENAEMREKFARADERIRLAKEAQESIDRAAATAKAAAERPDPDMDPAGARAWDAEQRAIRAEQAVAQLTNQFNGQVAQTQQASQNQQLETWVIGQANFARTRIADYDARIDFARTERAKFWQGVYPPDVATQIVANEELALVNGARERGVALGDLVVSMSNQWGYGQTMPANGNGNVRQAGQAQVLPPAGQEKLNQIRAGQAAQGLGRIATGQGVGPNAWQAMDSGEFKAYIANMDEDEYVEMVNDKKFGRLFSRKVVSVEQG